MRRGDVRAAILALIDDRPMHGYEMIKELEDRSGGLWRPSAGSIYPTLQLLEDEGLIAGTESDGKRRFELTDAGREERSKSTDAPWEAMRSEAGTGQLAFRRSLGQLVNAVKQAPAAADDAQLERIREALDEARRTIYAVLAEESQAGEEGRAD